MLNFKNKLKFFSYTLSVCSIISYAYLPVFADNSSPSLTSAASSISSSSKIIVNYYKITQPDSDITIDELTKDSPAFDLTVGLLDPNVTAIEGFDPGTAYAVLESASFYGETTNTGTIRQTGNNNSDNPMKLIANFKNVKFNGQSNILSIRIGYNVGGTPKSELVSFLVSQVPVDEEKETKKEPAPPPSPKVVINSCTYGGRTINTEESFTLNFDYFNSSNAVKMENLKIEVSGGENFVIKNNSNTFYVEELGPKGIQNQSIEFTALKSIKESSSYPITLKFSYEFVINKERKTGEDVTQIYIPVHKVVPPPRLTISDISCDPTDIEEEEESTVKIQIANKGESEVKNVSVAISGNFKSKSYVQEIGTLPSGKTTAPSFTITTLPKSKENSISEPTQPINDSQTDNNNPQGQSQGEQNNISTEISLDSKLSGMAVITFEDEEGNQHTIDRTFTVNVNLPDDDNMDLPDEGDGMDSENMDLSNQDDQKEKLSTPLLVGIISGSLATLGGASYFVIKKIKAKRSELLDEDI